MCTKKPRITPCTRTFAGIWEWWRDAEQGRASYCHRCRAKQRRCCWANPIGHVLSDFTRCIVGALMIVDNFYDNNDQSEICSIFGQKRHQFDYRCCRSPSYAEGFVLATFGLLVRSTLRYVVGVHLTRSSCFHFEIVLYHPRLQWSVRQ